MRLRARFGIGLTLLLALSGFAGCGSGTHYGTGSNGPENEDLFESDDPSVNGGGFGNPDGDQDSGSPAPGEGADNGSAEREIAEADIVQVQGNRLYALSRNGGLSIIDIGTRDKLRLLGRFRTQAATPFEMYVRGDVVIAMYTDWGRYVFNESSKTQEWVQSSEVIALDVRNPESIREIGQFDLPGEISDSRIVGDVLYLVSYRNGYCWGCGTKPTTIATSIDIGSPNSIRKVSELSFASIQNQYGWGKRSVTVTPKRMYVAGPEWGSNGQSSSTIQVVDIEDPKGELALGASVKATGTIQSRWQMDEHEGVLRVISQPDQWNLSKPPRVQTFEVTLSDELKTLGSLDLVLPRPEQLRSVRFDGPRGYAITFERTDPLFTIDLSNPAMPEQKGELEMPGWVHHMEPRGDRLFGLGFDNGNKEGSLNVSIFDVSDLSNPQMLDRVNFGGDWSYLGEDQSRIHKAFQILPDAGLILVPFSGYRYSQGHGYGCGNYASGVQLIDLLGDSLQKRGVAPSRGEARRAFLHQDRLFTVNDERTEVFDIGNRDQPKTTASLKLAHRVDRLIPAGDKLVRLGIDWWTNTASLEVVRASDADRYEPLGSVDLEEALVSSNDGSCGSGAYRYAYARIFVHGTRVYVVAPSAYWESSKQGTTAIVVDIQNPAKPRILTRQHYPFHFLPFDMTGQKWSTPVIEGGSTVVQLGDTIAVLDDGYDPYDYGSKEIAGSVHILDFRDAANPRHTKVEVPAGTGRTALQAHEKSIMLGRWSPVANKPGRVRFYVDRIDVTKPESPVLLPPVNVPGSLLSFDVASQRFVTVDYRREVFPSWRDGGCQGGYVDYDNDSCTVVHRTLNLVGLHGNGAKLVDSQKLDKEIWTSQVAQGDDRVFLIENYPYYDCWAGYGCGASNGRVVTIAGAREGELKIGDFKLGEERVGINSVAVSGQRLVVGGGWHGEAAMIDFGNIHAPRTINLGELHGYAQNIAVNRDRAYFALGNDGVQVFELPR